MDVRTVCATCSLTSFSLPRQFGRVSRTTYSVSIMIILYLYYRVDEKCSILVDIEE